MKSYAAIAALALIAACVSTPDRIVETPKERSAVPIPIAPDSDLARGFAEMSFNFDNAVLVGALSAQDAAPTCLHKFMQAAGIEPVPGAAEPKSFVPRHDTPLGDASILYIQARQLEEMRGMQVTVSTDCKALIGQVVLDKLKAVKRAVPLLLR